jgi:hypothetical protein
MNHEHILRYCARLIPDPEQDLALSRLVAETDCWTDFSKSAEYHGITPLVYTHLSRLQGMAACPVLPELRVLALRHRLYSNARIVALLEIIKALNYANIKHVILKGMALSHIIYAAPELRPMSDVDILVRKRDAYEAQHIVRNLGFQPAGLHIESLHEHHHLQMLTRRQEELEVNIEVHHPSTRHFYNLLFLIG